MILVGGLLLWVGNIYIGQERSLYQMIASSKV
jgi:hypothetical protein